MSLTFNMKKIFLTNGMTAYVDEDDFEKLSEYPWFVSFRKHNMYARRNTPGFNNKKILMHREILGITDSKIHIDHIDGDGLNNQKSNLRVCDQKLNMANRKKNIKGSSVFKGVSKRDNKWRANLAGKSIGTYDSEKEAALAYNCAASFRYREFARLNKV